MKRSIFLGLLLVAGCARDKADVSKAEAEPLFPVQQEGLWGYINVDGHLVIGPQFDGAWPFSENRALVRVGSKFGYANREGDMAIEPGFDDAWHFSGGLAPVLTDGQWVYIDTTGAVAVRPDFNPAAALQVRGSESRRLGRVQLAGRYGYENEDGEIVIEPQFDQAWRFVEGRARVKVGSQWGYIDTTGKMVVEPQFDLAWDFGDGLALVEVDSMYGYIDPDGKMVWGPDR